jgi:hypothetical protein
VSVSEVDIGAEVVEALVVAPGAAVLDEVGDGAFEISGSLVFFEQDAALQSTVKNSQPEE